MTLKQNGSRKAPGRKPGFRTIKAIRPATRKLQRSKKMSDTPNADNAAYSGSDAPPCSASPSDLLPPMEIIEAAAKVAMWMEKMGYRNWQLGGICDRRFAGKFPDAEEMRKALWPIREAQVMLEDNHPKRNEEGQRYAIAAAACEKLRDAHNRISLLYAALIGLPNDPCMAAGAAVPPLKSD